MGESFQFFDIILFAMVAAFLVLRLRSVLGRRTGNEQRRDPFARPPAAPGAAPGPASDNVVTLPDRGKSALPEPEPGPVSLATGLKQIHSADPNFDENG